MATFLRQSQNCLIFENQLTEDLHFEGQVTDEIFCSVGYLLPPFEHYPTWHGYLNGYVGLQGDSLLDSQHSKRYRLIKTAIYRLIMKDTFVLPSREVLLLLPLAMGGLQPIADEANFLAPSI